jgi:PAS domain S-box-containing protein
MERQMKVGNSINFVNRYLCKDGSVRWLSWRANYVAADQLTYATARDITDRIGFEEQLRLLHSAVMQTRESILITDAELNLPGPRIVFVNPAFSRMTGYTAEEAIGKTPRILQGPRTDRAVIRRLRRNLEKGEAFEGEAIQYRKDGTEYHQEWQVTPLLNADGKTTHYVAIQRDITEQRKLEMQLRQAQKMEAFGQLAGGVAHDFNNILAVIQMQAGLLKTEPEISPEQIEIAGEIEKAAQRGANLTRQLLLFSRQQMMQARNLNLHDSITGMAKMLQRTLGELFLLQFNFSKDDLRLHADPGMIDQILLNLVVNARDAMPKGGRIVIETSTVEFDEISAQQTSKARAGAFVCLSVTDTGCGIPPEILPQIFEPFFTTKEIGKGTGLGLATVFGIVQQHKGWINVYSEVGRGTTFRIYLPRLDEDSDTKFISAPAAAALGGNETILLVEDETPLRVSVQTILSRLGYRVLDAANGREALAIWKQHREDIRLLLTDMVMPGDLSGRELADRLLAENPRLKVIYSSGYSAEITTHDFLLEEGVNFLTKPFEAGKLAKTIRNRLDQAG